MVDIDPHLVRGLRHRFEMAEFFTRAQAALSMFGPADFCSDECAARYRQGVQNSIRCVQRVDARVVAELVFGDADRAGPPLTVAGEIESH